MTKVQEVNLKVMGREFEVVGRRPGGGRAYQGRRPDHEAMARALPREWLGRTVRPPQTAAKPEAYNSENSPKCCSRIGRSTSIFNVWHFHEKLAEEHGVQISYTWVKMARCKERDWCRMFGDN